MSKPDAAGRLPNCSPVAVVDIGSNSVRLVIYEGLRRNFTTLFNEKVACALGKSVASTGKLSQGGMDKALRALIRFRALCDHMQLGAMYVIATAAVRDASNGAGFIAAAEAICRTNIELLSGAEEARLAAYGVLAGIYQPDGLVGDLGGGSLELVDIAKGAIGSGVTLPLGGLTLQDTSANSLRQADKIVRDAFAVLDQLDHARDKKFYAVGGTWRAFAKLHMAQMGYPLRVMNYYRLAASEAIAFAQLLRRVPLDTLQGAKDISPERAQLLSYGALVLEHILRRSGARYVVFSAFGVREGLLFSKLPLKEQQEDALLLAAREMGFLRARCPDFDHELIGWSDALFASAGIDETAGEKRLRHAVCYLADIGWRAHPDYRGEQSMNIVVNATFPAIDHQGRAYLALVMYHRHEGFSNAEIAPRLRELASTRIVDQARILAGVFRIAALMSASVSGILPRTQLYVDEGRLILSLPDDLKNLASERVFARVKQLSRLLGCKPDVEIKQ
jgi:exopolyphosphatase/guanosine-5'-triphosphate,3'-diphosphate pyrophosphatase